MKNVAVPLINYKVFNYITCKSCRCSSRAEHVRWDDMKLTLLGTYMPLRSSSYIAANTIFPTRIPSANASIQACEAKYGVPTLTKAEVYARYHLSPAELRNSTHIIFSLGEFDPTSATEPAYLPLTANIHQSRVLYAPGVAHREDLFASEVGDGEGVKELRRTELEIFKLWAGGYVH